MASPFWWYFTPYLLHLQKIILLRKLVFPLQLPVGDFKTEKLSVSVKKLFVFISSCSRCPQNAWSVKQFQRGHIWLPLYFHEAKGEKNQRRFKWKWQFIGNLPLQSVHRSSTRYSLLQKWQHDRKFIAISSPKLSEMTSQSGSSSSGSV